MGSRVPRTRGARSPLDGAFLPSSKKKKRLPSKKVGIEWPLNFKISSQTESRIKLLNAFQFLDIKRHSIVSFSILFFCIDAVYAQLDQSNKRIKIFDETANVIVKNGALNNNNFLYFEAIQVLKTDRTILYS